MWAALGLALSAANAVFAWRRSGRAPANFYESDVYGMTPQTHRRYAAAAAFFALTFAAALFVKAIPAVPLLAAYVLFAIFYYSSFLRGFSDEE